MDLMLKFMRMRFSVMGCEKGGYIQTDGRKCCLLQRNNFERTVSTKLKHLKTHFVHIEEHLHKYVAKING